MPLPNFYLLTYPFVKRTVTKSISDPDLRLKKLKYFLQAVTLAVITTIESFRTSRYAESFKQ